MEFATLKHCMIGHHSLCLYETMETPLNKFPGQGFYREPKVFFTEVAQYCHDEDPSLCCLSFCLLNREKQRQHNTVPVCDFRKHASILQAKEV